MHQNVITFQEFADIFEELTFYQQVDTGPVMTTTGVHPMLGTVITIQDIAPCMILLSQHRFQPAMQCHGAA
jgi:hypothetical protein